MQNMDLNWLQSALLTEPQKLLLATLVERSGKERIFQFEEKYNDQTFMLVTSSKDLCLWLGSVGIVGRSRLCGVLFEFFNQNPNEVNVTISITLKIGQERPFGLFITKANLVDQHKYTYGIAPAH